MSTQPSQPEYTPDGASPIRVDPIALWAVSGFAGVVRLLRDQAESGVKWPDQVRRDLSLVVDQLEYIIDLSSGYAVKRPSLGGASGALARHLQ
jgi:hypothetical protein